MIPREKASVEGTASPHGAPAHENGFVLPKHVRQNDDMPVLIPERTIDSLFAFEFLAVAPTAMIWSPHNNRGAGTVDHEIRMSHRYFEFECKTIYRDNATAPWTVQVRMSQLRNYLAVGKQQLIYLLPARPANDAAPWLRYCAADPDANGRCQACSNPVQTAGPVHHRRWAGQQPHVAHAPAESRLQPWFNHWAWCISAHDLDAYIRANPTLVTGDYASIPADDLHLAAIAGSERLCHLFAAVDVDFRATHPFGGPQPPDPNPQPAAGEGPDLDGWTMPLPAEGVDVTFVPALDLNPEQAEQRVLAWY